MKHSFEFLILSSNNNWSCLEFTNVNFVYKQLIFTNDISYLKQPLSTVHNSLYVVIMLVFFVSFFDSSMFMKKVVVCFNNL